MKQKYTLLLMMSFVLGFASFPASGQSRTKAMPKQSREHILIVAEPDSNATALRTLSGIHLQPAGEGTFQLEFSQELKEDAVLEIKNKAGKLVYQKPVSIAGHKTAWRYNVGQLKPDTYSIEVKTSDTTYSTSFKIGK